MSDLDKVKSQVLGWMNEIGVPDADDSTRVSSLNLAWLVHQFEEEENHELILSDAELVASVDVQSVAEVLLQASRRSGR